MLDKRPPVFKLSSAPALHLALYPYFIYILLTYTVHSNISKGNNYSQIREKGNAKAFESTRVTLTSEGPLILAESQNPAKKDRKSVV